ncbi:hypothetical protein DFH11DRAFT_203068 [Phellopilus nigrolimitatus]|nr:hypothetical protein DFH11DRAFT_203068 [Phellopilus nigrolimitatus]
MFPVSRMQKIIKADRELPIVAKEAVFAISIATEEFIKRITSASQKQAERDKRTTVQKRHVAVVVKRADEFFFLEDVLMWEQEEPVSRLRKKAGGSVGNTSKGEFVSSSQKFSDRNEIK